MGLIIPCLVRRMKSATGQEPPEIHQYRRFGLADLLTQFANFPVFFPVSRESAPEKGSQETRSTATESSCLLSIT